MINKTSKRIRLPKNLERASVEVPEGQMMTSIEYDKLIAEDFENHRAEYITVELHGVPVLVKVQQTK